MPLGHRNSASPRTRRASIQHEDQRGMMDPFQEPFGGVVDSQSVNLTFSSILGDIQSSSRASMPLHATTGDFQKLQNDNTLNATNSFGSILGLLSGEAHSHRPRNIPSNPSVPNPVHEFQPSTRWSRCADTNLLGNRICHDDDGTDASAQDKPPTGAATAVHDWTTAMTGNVGPSPATTSPGPDRNPLSRHSSSRSFPLFSSMSLSSIRKPSGSASVVGPQGAALGCPEGLGLRDNSFSLLSHRGLFSRSVSPGPSTLPPLATGSHNQSRTTSEQSLQAALGNPTPNFAANLDGESSIFMFPNVAEVDNHFYSNNKNPINNRTNSSSSLYPLIANPPCIPDASASCHPAYPYQPPSVQQDVYGDTFQRQTSVFSDLSGNPSSITGLSSQPQSFNDSAYNPTYSSAMHSMPTLYPGVPGPLNNLNLPLLPPFYSNPNATQAYTPAESHELPSRYNEGAYNEGGPLFLPTSHASADNLPPAAIPPPRPLPYDIPEHYAHPSAFYPVEVADGTSTFVAQHLDSNTRKPHGISDPNDNISQVRSNSDRNNSNNLQRTDGPSGADGMDQMNDIDTDTTAALRNFPKLRIGAFDRSTFQETERRFGEIFAARIQNVTSSAVASSNRRRAQLSKDEYCPPVSIEHAKTGLSSISAASTICATTSDARLASTMSETAVSRLTSAASVQFVDGLLGHDTNDVPLNHEPFNSNFDPRGFAPVPVDSWIDSMSERGLPSLSGIPGGPEPYPYSFGSNASFSRRPSVIPQPHLPADPFVPCGCCPDGFHREGYHDVPSLSQPGSFRGGSLPQLPVSFTDPHTGLLQSGLPTAEQAKALGAFEMPSLSSKLELSGRIPLPVSSLMDTSFEWRFDQIDWSKPFTSPELPPYQIQQLLMFNIVTHDRMLSTFELSVFKTIYCIGDCDNARTPTRCWASHNFGSCAETRRWLRRNPFVYHYKHLLCPEIQSLKDLLKDTNRHTTINANEFQMLRYSDKLALQQACFNCKDGVHCQYSHSLEEQMYHPFVYKTAICNNQPDCVRPFCPFLHEGEYFRDEAGALKPKRYDSLAAWNSWKASLRKGSAAPYGANAAHPHVAEDYGAAVMAEKTILQEQPGTVGHGASYGQSNSHGFRLLEFNPTFPGGEAPPGTPFIPGFGTGSTLCSLADSDPLANPLTQSVLGEVPAIPSEPQEPLEGDEPSIEENIEPKLAHRYAVELFEDCRKPLGVLELSVFRSTRCPHKSFCPHTKAPTRCWATHASNESNRWLRRNPFVHKYKHLLCPHVRSDKNSKDHANDGRARWLSCPKGRTCNLAHSIEEQMYHPFVYKTQKCMNKSCERPFCPFLHDEEDSRPLNQLLKSHTSSHHPGTGDSDCRDNLPEPTRSSSRYGGSNARNSNQSSRGKNTSDKPLATVLPPTRESKASRGSFSTARGLEDGEVAVRPVSTRPGPIPPRGNNRSRQGNSGRVRNSSTERGGQQGNANGNGRNSGQSARRRAT